MEHNRTFVQAITTRAHSSPAAPSGKKAVPGESAGDFPITRALPDNHTGRPDLLPAVSGFSLRTHDFTLDELDITWYSLKDL